MTAKYESKYGKNHSGVMNNLKNGSCLRSVLTLGLEMRNLHCIDAINIDSNPVIFLNIY